MLVYVVTTSANVTKVDLYELYPFSEDRVTQQLWTLDAFARFNSVCVCVPQLVLETSSFVGLGAFQIIINLYLC